MYVFHRSAAYIPVHNNCQFVRKSAHTHTHTQAHVCNNGIGNRVCVSACERELQFGCWPGAICKPFVRTQNKLPTNLQTIRLLSYSNQTYIKETRHVCVCCFFFRNAKMLLRVAYAHLNQIAQHKGYCKLQLQLSVFIASAPSLTITFHAIVGFTHTHTHTYSRRIPRFAAVLTCVCVCGLCTCASDAKT